MYCRNCGAEIPDGSRYCTNCGQSQTPDRNIYEAPVRNRPSNYMILSILVTIFCCLPFGIVGIIFASRVDSAWNSGHYDDAVEFSRKARNWSLWGIALCLLVYIAYFALIAIGVISGFSDLWGDGFSDFQI